MNNLAKALFALATLAASASVAHVDHEHAAPDVDLQSWQSHLQAFQQTGAAAELSNALLISQALLPLHPHSPQHLYLGAQTAQAAHRFADARRLLEQLLQLRPDMNQARLMQASVWLVQGEVAKARAQCKRLRKPEPVILMACLAQTSPRPGDAEYRKLGLVVARFGAEMPAAIGAWLHSVLGDLASATGRLNLAAQHYADALQRAPLVRYRTHLVDLYLAQGDLLEAARYVAMGPQSLGMQIKQLLIETRLGSLAVDDSRREQIARRFSADIARGDFSHGREMAEFYLGVTDEPEKARHVLANYLHEQREPEDLRLLALANSAISREL